MEIIYQDKTKRKQKKMSATHGGKGSGQRARSVSVDHKKFSDNWDLAFSQTKKPEKEVKEEEKKWDTEYSARNAIQSTK